MTTRDIIGSNNCSDADEYQQKIEQKRVHAVLII
eukprot:CAMPEP_0171462688 /NCGR_PEP_ID=MMETSP0945-20130129/6621_1 /TAXON_ID=109269 /ORGANISM="Vaucheria litorea, Strain CCMP2940" /LENGTH=33 /DNA_ID= /DNA_START= /DNA_END= /DNA_ORIENTATION=